MFLMMLTSCKSLHKATKAVSESLTKETVQKVDSSTRQGIDSVYTSKHSIDTSTLSERTETTTIKITNYPAQDSPIHIQGKNNNYHPTTIEITKTVKEITKKNAVTQKVDSGAHSFTNISDLYKIDTKKDSTTTTTTQTSKDVKKMPSLIGVFIFLLIIVIVYFVLRYLQKDFP